MNPTRFQTLADAASIFGYKSGASMRRVFERGHLPADCLLRVGSRGLRVDVDRLAAWLREQRAYGQPIAGAQQ